MYILEKSSLLYSRVRCDGGSKVFIVRFGSNIISLFDTIIIIDCGTLQTVKTSNSSLPVLQLMPALYSDQIKYCSIAIIIL